MKNVFMNRRSPGSRAASLLVLFVLLAGMFPAASFAAPIVDKPVSSVDAAVAATVTISGVPAGYASAATATWTSATVTPSISATASAPDSITALSYIVTLPGGVPATATAPVSAATLAAISAEGTTSIKYSATVDTATPPPGESATQTAYVRIDKTAPPTPPVTGATGSVPNTATLTIAASDALSGIKTIEVTGTFTAPTTSTATVISTSTIGPITFTAVGTYVLHVVAVDNAGNRSGTNDVPFTITDTNPPKTTLLGYTSGWLSEPTTVTLTATDMAGTGVKATYYSVNSTSTFTTYTAGFSVAAEGTTTVRFYSIDNSSNVETVNVVNVLIDKTQPISTISGVPAGWVGTDVTATITATDALSGVASIWSSLDGSAPVSTAGTRTVGVTTEGTHTIAYGAVDAAGNRETTKTATVRIDKTKPVSSVDATANYMGIATVNIMATDALSGVAISQWRLDGGSTTTGNIVVSSVAGTHTLEYFSTDQAGNVEATKTAQFHVTAGTGFTNLSPGGTIAYGAKGTVAGNLIDGITSSPVANRLVVLQSSTNGVTFLPSMSATTNADGSFNFLAPMKNKNKTWFRVVFAGDDDYVAGTSMNVVYTPKVKVSTPSTKSRLRNGRPLFFTATITPDHPSTKKSTTISFERYKIVKGKHVNVVRYYAKVTDKGTYSSLSRTFSLSRGTWYVRIVAKADSKHALTNGTARKLVIR